MLNLIKRFFLFLFPILKSVALDIIADEVNKLASAPPKPRYSDIPKINRDRRSQFTDYHYPSSGPMSESGYAESINGAGESGKIGYADGVDQDDNPFSAGTPRWKAWNKAWLLARDEAVAAAEGLVDVELPHTLPVLSAEFDSSSHNWNENGEYNLMYLSSVQNYANAKLKSQGHLFLNEVHDQLGLPRTKHGASYGWVQRDGVYVDFGFNMPPRHNPDGYTLSFNVTDRVIDHLS